MQMVGFKCTCLGSLEFSLEERKGRSSPFLVQSAPFTRWKEIRNL